MFFFKKSFEIFEIFFILGFFHSGFVVERYNEIKNFVPEPFWYLTLTAEKNGQTATFNWQRVRLVDEAMCAAFYER